MDPGSASQGVQGCPSPGMLKEVKEMVFVETDCHLGLEMVL